MLVTPYRVWARAAGEDVSRWMTSLNMEWIANGPKKSAEDAVYQFSIKTEGYASEYGKLNVAIIDDLEKGLEKVLHAEIRSKASVYRFPETIMNTALSMYTGSRRIMCGKAYSRAARTKMGVLAGCPIAMGLFLLVNLDPVDRFWKQLPRYIKSSIMGLKIFVDDFMVVFRFDTNKSTEDQIVTRVNGAYIRLAEQIKRAGGKVAAGKCNVAATDHKIAIKLAKSLNCCVCGVHDCFSDKCSCSGNHKIKPMKDLVMLGVDYSAGRPVDYSKNTERLVNASDKASKIVSLAKGGPFLFNVMRMHIQSVALYGARVNGISDKAFEKVRSSIRAAISTRAQGGSAAMDFLLQKQQDIDPAFAGNTLPLLQWATRVNVASWHNDKDTLRDHSKAWVGGCYG